MSICVVITATGFAAVVMDIRCIFVGWPGRTVCVALWHRATDTDV